MASKVPVIRLFGYARDTDSSSNENGPYQCCLNVHGYYPRIVIDSVPGLTLMELAEVIDRSVGARETCVVRNAKYIRLTNFFGYHEFPETFIEIELFRPSYVALVAELVSTPGRLGPPKTYRCFEVHIPYLLHFLVDHGIQGVTPFGVHREGLQETVPKTTTVEVEYSTKCEGIVKRESGGEIAHPLPSPLASDASGDPLKEGFSLHRRSSLVCGIALAPLWREEFDRFGPSAFPYTPEGILDGIARPDCAEMDIAEKRVGVKEIFLKSLREGSHVGGGDIPTEEKSRGVEDTQFFINDVDLNEPDETVMAGANNGDKKDLHTYLSPTMVVAADEEEETAEVDLTKGGVAASTAALPALVAVPPLPLSTKMPLGRVVLKYKPPPTLEKTNIKSLHRLSLTNTQAVAPPLRAGSPLHKGDRTNVLTYLTLAVVDVVMAVDRLAGNPDPMDHPLVSISLRFVDERIEGNQLFIFGITDYACVVPDLIRCESEVDMISQFRALLVQLDPCVVLAWDNSRYGLGYIQKRAQVLWGFSSLFSRIIGDKTDDSLAGRLSLDLWRVLRNDTESGVRLATTSFTGAVQTVLGKTIPNLPFSVLAAMWQNRPMDVVDRMKLNTQLVLEIEETVRVLAKSVEMARVYGMSIESAFTRGSQYRVECVLLRACKALGYQMPSFSKGQVKHQPATEGIPMVLEPKSGLIVDPVCVFDFQSLYPSICIAYNICYSTCLGRAAGDAVCSLGPCNYFLRSEKDVAKSIILPGDTMYVQRSQRVGLVSRMCHEILQTRILVKQSMKKIAAAAISESTSALLKQLDARQLSLKLLSNVVYGYTTASFSGRMPCAEIADSILLTARASLESVMNRAEQLGGEIVYGDTDSLFVRLRGKSLEEAFAWGEQFVAEISKHHPWPMKLVFEKVYHPCCLVTKKRYVGRAFDYDGTTDGGKGRSVRLDAKGIETIRRDTCPAVAVTVERILNQMYDSVTYRQNFEQTLMHACVKEFARLVNGALPMKYFVFQNQVRRFENYRDMSRLPPAARVAADAGRTDTERGDRIAYVITNGPVGSKLADQVAPPVVLLNPDTNGNYQNLNMDYYLRRQVVPAVQRIFGPIANKAFSWLDTAKSLSSTKGWMSLGLLSQSSGFAHSRACALCGNATASAIFGYASTPMFCVNCLKKRESFCVAKIESKTNHIERRIHQLQQMCLGCSGGNATVAKNCSEAYHCEIFFQKNFASRPHQEILFARKRMQKEIPEKFNIHS